MRPPPLRLVQGLIAAVGFASYLVLAMATWRWEAAAWGPTWTGLGIAIATSAYIVSAFVVGPLADRFGRAPMGAIGGLVGAIGCIGVATTDGWWTLVALTLTFGGTGFFFPSAAGLISDAEGSSGRPPPALHVKVSGYNLGWSGGNLIGFALGGLFAELGLDAWAGSGVAALAYGAVALALLPWLRLPPQPPAPLGDRAPHPLLPRLVVAGRLSLLVICLANFGLIGQALAALRADGAIGESSARALQGLVLAAFAGGYFAAFFLLGRWSGWVLRPWRLWLWQIFLPLGGVVLALLPLMGLVNGPALAAAGVLLGLGYGGAYTASLYYSLRLPEGASRAAGLHESCLGVGNTLAPGLAGLFCWWLWSVWPPDAGGGGLFALGIWCSSVAALALLIQASIFSRPAPISAEAPDDPVLTQGAGS